MGRSLLLEWSWRSADERTRSEIRFILESAERRRGFGERGRGEGSPARVLRSRICVTLEQRPVRIRAHPVFMLVSPWLRVCMCRIEP